MDYTKIANDLYTQKPKHIQVCPGVSIRSFCEEGIHPESLTRFLSVANLFKESKRKFILSPGARNGYSIKDPKSGSIFLISSDSHSWLHFSTTGAIITHGRKDLAKDVLEFLKSIP